MNHSAIEWTDRTWNPVSGCSKVSQGCKNCYAERLWPKVEAAERKRDGDENWRSMAPRMFIDVLVHPDRLKQPLRIRKPQRIFVNSMSDLFHEDVPFAFIDEIFAVMALCPQHTFQVLTKRPQRMLDYLTDPRTGARIWRAAIDFSREAVNPATDPGWPMHNIWIGVSVEDQATADERIPLLLQTPAAVRFLSCEPLLGKIDLRAHTACQVMHPKPIDWVIAGGESGPGARPSHPEWFRSLRDQCAAAGVPFFFKQWGNWMPGKAAHRAGIIPAEEHHPFGILQPAMARVGKKLAGRTLDGREHSEFPI